MKKNLITKPENLLIYTFWEQQKWNKKRSWVSLQQSYFLSRVQQNEGGKQQQQQKPNNRNCLKKWKANLIKFIGKCKEPWSAKTILREKNKVGDLTLPDFKIYLQADQSNQDSANNDIKTDI